GSPIGDLAPALIALGGRVVLRKGGKTRALPLENFFIAYGKQDRAPGEFVLAVRVDLDGRRIKGARIACGGMAATPKRAANAERALAGASLDDPPDWRAAVEAIGRDFTPLT